MENNNKQPIKTVTVKAAPETKPPKKKSNHTVLKSILAIICGLALLAAGILGGIFYQKQQLKKAEAENAPVIENTSISQKVTELKQLTTAQLTYHGLIEFSEGKYRFINEKEFLMTYTGKVTAGVDMSKAKITESSGQITIVLPDAEIFTKSIDPNSIQFYDIKKALFNKSDRDDTVEAEKEAYSDMDASMDKKELLDTAKAQAKAMILEMFTPIVSEDTQIVVV